MRYAKLGDTVRVKYIAKLKTGQVVDFSRGEGPVEFQIGRGDVIPGFEVAVIGMEVGDRKTVLLEPKDAFGEREEGLRMSLDKKAFPNHMIFQIGEKVYGQESDGKIIDLYIASINGDTITLDKNHPLAGEFLELDIELINILYN